MEENAKLEANLEGSVVATVDANENKNTSNSNGNSMNAGNCNDEMLRLMKKQVMYARAGFIVGIVTAACCLVVAFSIYTNVNKVVGPILSLSEELEVAVGNLETITDSIINDDVVGQLNDGVERLSQIDIDTLNKGISDFSAAVEPIGNFAKRFSR